MSSSFEFPTLRCLTARWGARAGTFWQSPIGPMELLASQRGLRLVEFIPPDALPLGKQDAGVGGSSPPRAVGSSPPRVGEGPGERSRAILDQATAELAEYFAGSRTVFTLPLDLEGTSFQLSVWNALLTVPYGTTITYRQLAAAAGRPAAVRSAGAANGANPISILVPCHRVVGSDGSLTGYAGGLAIKRYLIDFERGVAEGSAARPGLLPPQ